KLVSSKSDANRVIMQKGVKVDNIIVDDPFKKITIDGRGVLIQKGKLHYVKVIGH
ncbi:hypothetical protein HY224_00185, partial [Candidatus Uhrbacteria bacterium]|nr:hypothetical protein [Candidatus Uhrbacteria bacterium]